MITQVESAPDELPKNEAHSLYRWTNGRAKVWFSASRKGDAISIHLMAKRKIDKLCLRIASNEFVDYLFDEFAWCKMIFCITSMKSTRNLAKKCGFEWLAERDISRGDKIETITVLVRFKK